MTTISREVRRRPHPTEDQADRLQANVARLFRTQEVPAWAVTAVVVASQAASA